MNTFGNGQFLNYSMSIFSYFKYLPSWELPYLIFVFQIFPGFLVDVLCFLDYVQSCGLEQLNPKTPRNLRTTYLVCYVSNLILNSQQYQGMFYHLKNSPQDPILLKVLVCNQQILPRMTFSITRTCIPCSQALLILSLI